MNFDNALRKLDEIDLSPKEFKYENKNFKYKFILAYPMVKTISDFYKAYYMKYRNQPAARAMAQANDSMSNMEYVNLYIKSIMIESKKDG